MIQRHLTIFLILCSGLALPQFASAHVKAVLVDSNNFHTLIEDEVRDSFSYSGLASFYNKVIAYIVNDNGIEKLSSDHLHKLESSQSLAIVGHHKILVLSNIDGTISSPNENFNLKIDNNTGPAHKRVEAKILSKSDLNQLPKSFHRLKYVHLWNPLRLLCVGIEKILLWLHSLHSFGWAITIILLSLIFKIFMVPANILLTRSQRNMSRIQACLAPELEVIRENFSGEEAHKKFMVAHKAQGVTPFYTLKPLLFTLAPIPFSIAVFNVLGETDMISGHSFLWINNLTNPDSIFDFGMQIPLLGSSLNLLPVLMTLLTIIAASRHQNEIVNAKELRKQKLNLYFMAVGFLLMFYPFPSAMVLYWTLANLWQLIQQRFIRV